MSSILERLMKGLSFGDKPLTYEQEKELARNEDSKVRRKLAARRDVRPEILYYLADDDVTEVRREIAANTMTPRQADLLLARDGDGDVRVQLAHKIGNLVPGLNADVSDRLSQFTIEALEILARDQLTHVRAVLADTLKEITNAPPHVIKQLARDTELEVSGPVLRYSPQLSDDDLLEIINSSPIQGVLIEISWRSGLRERVSDAIVATDKRAAITSLLGNRSAQIREETLDRLIERAPQVEEWHEPLVLRPNLSLKAAQHIAGFVADSLLEVMQAREDLDSETLHKVKEEVHRRLDAEPAGKPGAASPAGSEALSRKEKEKSEIERAKRMHEAGELDERVLTESLDRGDHGFVAGALSVMASLPMEIVNRIIESESAKAIVALAREAGLNMRLAVQLQRSLAHVPPHAVIQARDGNDFPLSEEESHWQLNFFKSMFRGGRDSRPVEDDGTPEEEPEGPFDPGWTEGEREPGGKGGPVDPGWTEGEMEPESPVDPGWTEGEREPEGPFDPGWTEDAKKPGGKGDPVDPGWSEDDKKAGGKRSQTDPDWVDRKAREKAAPSAKRKRAGGPVDPEWSHTKRKAADKDSLEPAWARDKEEHVSKTRAQLDWETEDQKKEDRKKETEKEEPLTASERARRLQAEGKLDEEAVAAAVSGGDRAFVYASLSLLSGLDHDVVAKIMSARTALGVTSLAWKAGLSMQLATSLQLRIARIPVDKVLSADPDGSYPLDEDEMTWQIEFFAE